MKDTLSQRKPPLRKAFSALKHRDYRLFWTGQAISLIGTWMQNVAQAWVVLELTNSAYLLGVVSAVQFSPFLFLSFFAGAIADRFPKRTILLITQSTLAVLAAILALDVALDWAKYWHILVIALLMGIVNSVDMPTRQAYLIDLVDKDTLMNAIVLNSSIFNLARILGPAVAGIILAKLGAKWCFGINAISFIPVVIGIYLISARPLVNRRDQSSTILGDIRSGLQFIKETPVLTFLISLIAVLSTVAMNFQVLIPLYAKYTLHKGETEYGMLMAANGIGALMGASIIAVKTSRPSIFLVISGALGLTITQIVLFGVSNYHLAFLILVVTGISMIALSTSANTMVQTNTPYHLRGRVMSIYTFVFMGFTPVGSFLSGAIAHAWGANYGFALGSVIGLTYTLFLLFIFKDKLKN